jgi:sterol O-acyltransferase
LTDIWSDNGYLSEEYKMRATLQVDLKQLDNIVPVESPSVTSPKVSTLPTSYLDRQPTASGLKLRRQDQRSDSYEDGASNIAQVAAVLEAGKPLDTDQIHTFERIVKWEIDALTADLRGKCTTSGNIYPTNLTISNHYEFIVLPTLVYELEYPRSDSIDWHYIAEKAVAVFGILGIMQLVAQSFIYPVVVRSKEYLSLGTVP